jgi:UDP-glucose 4-epimerase
MNILITGGCGFIGVNLIAYLKRNTSDSIVVLDNLSLGRKESLLEFDVDFIEGDITDEHLINRVMKDIDAVIHLAADTRVMDSIENPDFNYHVNVNGTYNLLAASRKYGVDKFIFASTGGAILGDVMPPVHEGIVPRPISPYGASKLCGEAYCSAFAGAYGIKTASLRFSNVYGPRSYHKGSVIAHFFKQIIKGEPLVVYGDGEQTRDYVYVDDLCSAVRNAMVIEKGGQTFQLGTGVETSIHRLIDLIKQCVGNDYTIQVEYESARKGEIIRNFTDVSFARKSLGYEPEVALEEGLKKTWEWFISR